ncbi:MAG: hypothetical protein KUA43_14925 [Hoeflea sp.]|uniref:hypothetical protein n=1 Tax=Hoeflea sp. TaxID=1940281 RepID=UPI001D52A227|nr:hypothetical protein [Hoeflea sp.]MBU4531453.1 hypothetical protein [Alphaproteobacteria bacterium]MBU4544310.1 hypothetical protein [Alphaproteobacteria bacterium]MBU4550453.1 hypothetical protein [Alphaproteobacteria bacterium]MBV1724729.1 hypothetical protein [Hoeflea sp.]MBV1760749.1 hypothetical protein [Hoeflea sp.]
MMIYSIGPTSRPFEPSRGANALREEDEFMELHGGRGSRLVYLTVEWLGSRFDAAWRLASGSGPAGRRARRAVFRRIADG